MEFGELPPQMTDAFMRILNDHLDVAQVNLENDKILFPVLAFVNRDFSLGQVIPLQPPMTAQINSEAALGAAIQILGSSYYEKALFSCSTKIRAEDDVIEAIKTVIFDASGVAVTFYTPYHYKGMFKKKVAYSQNIFDGVTGNFFQR